jgi:hypothetical protein
MELSTNYEVPNTVALKYFHFAAIFKDSFGSLNGFALVLDSGETTYLLFSAFTPRITFLLETIHLEGHRARAR